MTTKSSRSAITTPITDAIDTGSAGNRDTELEIHHYQEHRAEKSPQVPYHSRFTQKRNTFDGEPDGVSVCAVGVLDVEEVGPAVFGADLLDEEPRDVAVLPLGVLDHLLGEVAPLQLLAGVHPQGAPVPRGAGGDGVGAHLHLQAHVAPADRLDLLRHGVPQHLGGACVRKKIECLVHARYLHSGT